ncbi:hypothetical protein, partial [Streptococcus pneumoniae]|uniref:hypothetical protein n=1 Tax=Streptococcus pneumoniae TaxID=1313 RepID=UPI001CBBC568
LDTAADALTGAAEMTGIGSLVERLGTPRERTARTTVEEAVVPALGAYRDLFDDGPGREEARLQVPCRPHQNQDDGT